jgi:tellurite resistance protein
MVFGKLFGGKAKDAINQFSGNKDFLEGLCAACALTAAAEGGIDDKEYDTTLSVIRANSAIAAAFSSTEIESCFGKMAPKTASRSGKAELMNEIREVIDRDKSGAMGQAVVLAALDVADQGGISDAEVAVMKRIAEVCGVNYDKLAAS